VITVKSLPGLTIAGFAEGNGKVRAGVDGAAESLAVKALVFEEEHWVVAANGRAEQAHAHRGRSTA
jgi:hypothetical protein